MYTVVYEQGADVVRIEAYLKRWWQWVGSGVDDVRIETYLKRWWQWVRSGVDGVLRVVACFAWGLVGPLHFFNAPYWRVKLYLMGKVV